MVITIDFVDPNGEQIAKLNISPLESESSDISTLVCLDPLVARAQCEEPIQLLEGARYEYEFVDQEFTLDTADGNASRLIEASRLAGRSHSGFLYPNLNPGRLALLARDRTGQILGSAAVEVRSRKLSYRDDYRSMIEEITEQCLDLLLDIRAPTALRTAPDPGNNPKTITQRFSFLKALLGSSQFQNALHRLTSRPHHRWEADEVMVNLNRGFRSNSYSLRQISRARRRVSLPIGHFLQGVVESLPERLTLRQNVQTNDTPENRFIKFILENFLAFLSLIQLKLDEIGSTDERLRAEVMTLKNKLMLYLSADLFIGVSLPNMLPIGSPVLQRKEGYREIFQAWLRFDMAARLIWSGGDDLYHAGQRDIATLYEYWVFFKLLNIVTKIFALDKPAVDQLIQLTSDGFGLMLKTGEHLGFQGVTLLGGRPLRVRFSYNRSFISNDFRSASGSWTERMRPDYTLSLWPADFKEHEAEAQELIVHVHFDAKYRIDNISQLFGVSDKILGSKNTEIDLSDEKRDQKLGKYKRADLLKMHAYRDAIRRSHGAYVLYPGDVMQKWQGFHEILPGLGAFPLKPGGDDSALTKFISDIVFHISNRATTSERTSYHIFQSSHAKEMFPVYSKFIEFEEGKRRLPPLAEIHVILFNCNDSMSLEWILERQLYILKSEFTVENERIKNDILNSRYFLLCSNNQSIRPVLFSIFSQGPSLISREVLLKNGFPKPLVLPFYLVFDLKPIEDLNGDNWEASRLYQLIDDLKKDDQQTVTLDRLLSLCWRP